VIVVVLAGKDALAALVLILGHLGVMLLHEWGHVLAARRRRCSPYRIELYPIHGRTHVAHVPTRFDAGVIAWGGPLIQLAVAAPLLAWLFFFGFSKDGPSNAALALFGVWSPMMAVLNLCPVAGLDGCAAWPIVPGILRSMRARRLKIQPPRRGDWVH
jgi:hypothetical protein